jgi:hypothetical protein
MKPLLLGGVGADFSGAKKDLPPTYVTGVAPCKQKTPGELSDFEGDVERLKAFDFEDERFLSFVKSNYKEEAHICDAWTSAKKAYKACAQGSLKKELKRTYEAAKKIHGALLRKARSAYMENGSNAESGSAGAAKKTPSKHRNKRNTIERTTLDKPCGCSCEGVHCGFSRTTSTGRYDITTQRICCNACRANQNAAMKWLATKHRSLFYATRKTCWLNQSEDVRKLGVGSGRQYARRKVLSPH